MEVAVTKMIQLLLGKAGLSHNPARDNEFDDRCRRSTATVVGRPIVDFPGGGAPALERSSITSGAPLAHRTIARIFFFFFFFF